MLDGVGARCGTVHKSASVLIGVSRGEFLVVGRKGW